MDLLSPPGLNKRDRSAARTPYPEYDVEAEYEVLDAAANLMSFEMLPRHDRFSCIRYGSPGINSIGSVK